MDDIAKRAGVSRPLIYLKFKNKDELFAGVFNYLTEGRFEGAIAAINGAGSPRARLLAAFEIMLIEPWTKIIGHPMSADFYETCSVRLLHVTAAYARNAVKCAESVLGSYEVEDVFFLATEGLHSDLPTAKVLLKRLACLSISLLRSDAHRSDHRPSCSNPILRPPRRFVGLEASFRQRLSRSADAL